MGNDRDDLLSAARLGGNGSEHADFTPLSDAERARRWRTFSAVWLYAFAIIVVAIAVWSVT